MTTVTGKFSKEDLQMNQLPGHVGQTVELRGAVHALRDLGGVVFLTLRKGDGIVQCVCRPAQLPEGLCQEAAVKLTGTLRTEPRAPRGLELGVETIEILSLPAEPMSVPIAKEKLNLKLDTELALRPVTVRNLRERAVFRVQAAISGAFRSYLDSQGFCEIHTPKIVSAGAEGGSNIFRLSYFGRKAFLAQSPQFYKQTMVGSLERVYEVAPVFRAEKHATVRHLNEYTSLDCELGYIDSFYDLLELETGFLKHCMETLKTRCPRELQLLGAEVPDISEIPCVSFEEAKRLASEKYGRPIRDPFDLEPEEEHLIGRYWKEKTGSDFVFVTHYPSKKRPFYAMDDPADPRYTLSFDLLFKGIEITTGGQRIHDYQAQVDKMLKRGMDPAEFEDFLMIHKHGMPPHGGMGIGLERLTMQLCGLENVREACLFPRDIHRLTP